MDNSDVQEKIIEYNKQKEEKIQELARSVMNRMPLFIAIGIGIFWVFYGTIEVLPTQLSVVERIGLTICTVVLAITYCNLIADGGFRSARESQDYEKADGEYNDAQKQGNSNKEEIMEYAKDIARDNLRDCRARNLDLNGLKYKDYFDADGNYIGGDYKLNKSLRRKQKRCIRKCINQRIIIPNIFGNISSKYFGLRKEVTQKDYQRKEITTQTIVRVILSIFSVGMMFNFLGFSIGSMIFAFFQIILWTASGFSQRLKNFNFIKDIMIPQMKEKTLIITGYMGLTNEKKKYYETRVQDIKDEKLMALGLLDLDAEIVVKEGITKDEVIDDGEQLL